MPQKKIACLVFGEHPSTQVRARAREKYAADYDILWKTIDIYKYHRTGKEINRSLFLKIAFRIRNKVSTVLSVLENHHQITSSDILYIIKYPPRWFNFYRRLHSSAQIYDFDDPMWLKQFGGPREFSKKISGYDGFTCDNILQYEKALEFNENGLIIRGGVPEFHIEIKDKRKNNVTLIWVGSSSTVFYFISIRDIVREILSTRSNVNLIIMGSSIEAIGLEGPKVSYVESYREEDISRYLSISDIGLFPLLTDELSNARGNHKAEVYKAAGIPVIASHAQLTREVIQEGDSGYICKSNIEWLEKILNLVDNPEQIDSMKKFLNNNYDPKARNRDEFLKLKSFFERVGV
jgi:glycosyltransferase involved in cell wall biosynthesis